MKRFKFAIVYYAFSTLVMIPALLVLKKMPDRRGNRRIRIIKTILFWLLLQNFLNMGEKWGMLTGIFNAPQSQSISFSTTIHDHFRSVDGMDSIEYDYELIDSLASYNVNQTLQRIARHSAEHTTNSKKQFHHLANDDSNDQVISSVSSKMQIPIDANSRSPSPPIFLRMQTSDLSDASKTSKTRAKRPTESSSLNQAASEPDDNRWHQFRQVTAERAPSDKSVYNIPGNVDFGAAAAAAAISIRDLEVDLSSYEDDSKLDLELQEGDEDEAADIILDETPNDNEPRIGQIVDITNPSLPLIDKSHLREDRQFEPNGHQANANSLQLNSNLILNLNDANKQQQLYSTFKQSTSKGHENPTQIKTHIDNNNNNDNDNADHGPNDAIQMRLRRHLWSVHETTNETKSFNSSSANANATAIANSQQTKTLLDSNAMIMYLCWIVQVTKRIVSIRVALECA